ncbi:YkvA family protein [Paenibacillus sp. S-38]|uniref:YkvA family protein n=1 Tax=Paenibacillus sp. S-38 TaxID=3416710 RepID=UPI003CF6DBAD
MLDRIKREARRLKSQLMTLYLCAKDPRVPFGVRLFALLVAAYAFSPIDLIPDFIPVLGYLDDLILVPLGIMLVLRWIPKPVLEDNRRRAEALQTRPKNWVTAALFILVWILLALWLCHWLVRVIGSGGGWD